MYYRIAYKRDQSPNWQWKSTVLGSLHILIQWLRFYHAFPQECLRVFSASSREQMNEQLIRENAGSEPMSVPVVQFLRDRKLEVKMVESPVPTYERSRNEYVSSIILTSAPLFNERSWGGGVLNESNIPSLEMRRIEVERGMGGDHDIPYQFALSPFMPQTLAWVTLLARQEHGELLS